MSEAVSVSSDQVTPPKKPKGWIRWSGLWVFIAIVAALVGLMYVGITQLLKNQLEEVASEAWGAKVEIGSLDLGVMPLKVGVRNLQMTDPEKPMENLWVLKEISATLSLYHLVVGRTVIEDIVFRDLALHQPRTTSGALVKKTVEIAPEGQAETASAKTETASSGFKMPAVAMPDTSEVLKRETLQTLVKAQQVQQQADKISQTWSEVEKNVPNSSEIAHYEKRFKALSEGNISSLEDIQAKQKQFETLKKELENKKANLEKGRDLLQTELPKLKDSVAELKSLPEKDYQRLITKFSLDQKGLSNVTYLLFGSKIQGWTDEAIYWYEKAQPFISKLQAIRAETEAEDRAAKSKRALGLDVAFVEKDPQPDFIIKRIKGSASSDWGQTQVNISQVTFDHPQTKLPILFKVSALPVGQTRALSIVGQSNFIDRQHPVNEADVSWQGYDIRDWKLSSDKALPIEMKQAKTDVTGKIILQGLTQLNATFNLNYHQVEMDANQSNSEQVKRYLAPVFEDIQQFTVDSAITGTIYAPKVTAKSNLDKLLSNALNKVWQRELATAKAQLKQQLNEKLSEKLRPINQQLSELLGEQVSVESDYQAVQGMLQAKLESQWQDQRNKIEQQLQAEQKKIEQQLQAERDKQEARLKAEAEKQKKAAEETAKKEAQKLIEENSEKLKNMFKF